MLQKFNRPIHPFNNKIILLLLIFVFVGPMIAAHLLYYFNKSVALPTLEKGQLLSPPILVKDLAFFNDSFLGKWQLVQIAENNAVSVDKATTLVERIHLALGKEKSRVQYREISLTKILKSFKPSEFSGLFELTEGSIVIIDPKGWLIMHYANPVDPIFILKDMKRLLRFSHSG